MSWHWFAFLSDRPDDAFAVAPVHAMDGRLEGYFAAWKGDGRRPPRAVAIDPRAVDPAGAEAWVSLALSRPGVRVLYDDPAVCQAMRRVLAAPPVDAMSTLARDSSAIAGALTAVRGGSSELLADDPFARIFPTRLLRVAPGFVGEMLPPAGPVIQRYSGAPWPWDSFVSAKDPA